MPQPRPALRRAPDAEVHPALVILPDAGSATVVLPEPEAGKVDSPSEQQRDRKAKSKKGKAKKAKAKSNKAKKAKSETGKKAKSAKGKDADSAHGLSGGTVDDDSIETLNGTVGKFRGAGRATSDVLIGAPAKRSTLKVRIPAELHQELRGAAAASGADIDDLLSEILAAWLAAPERW
jgi:hypothetical protein